MKRFAASIMLACCFVLGTSAASAADKAPDFAQDIAPIFQKYCAGCHTADDAGGELALDSFAGVQKGGEQGPVIVPGDSAASRLMQVLTGKAEPAMPPEGEQAPQPAELALLKAWIDAGAQGPDGAEPTAMLRTPKITPAAHLPQPIAAVAYSPDGTQLAVARFAQVELRSPDGKKLLRTLDDHAGKVNAVEFSHDGQYLIAASGVGGLYGEARLWQVSDGSLVRSFRGHRDTLYAATMSPDGKFLATASYDHSIVLWNLATGEQVRSFDGHNGAVYDLAFSPDGTVLASASGDETVKLWSVATGQRLDTLSQPEGEQYTVAFSPDGQFIVAGGADNRIRVWRFVSKEKPQINPIEFARFAHEGAIVQLGFRRDGAALVSVAEDRTIKLFETSTYTQIHAYEPQPDATPALAIAPGGESFAVGRLDGSLQIYSLPAVSGEIPTASQQEKVSPPAESSVAVDASLSEQEEKEANDTPEAAMPVALPATVKGTIHATRDEQATDVDLYRIEAKQGESLIVEINAARSGSPLDSKVEVLNAAGEPMVRVLLQAVRDSYFTFRGKNSIQSNDYRIHNFEEMKLNEYLYAQGEVVRLYRHPRGPDSGFDVYAHAGKRRTFFDTTPVVHALNETCYIVEPRTPGETLVANGLPVFPVYYENDDASWQTFGSDSRLMFTAPADGAYLVRVSDARGFQGENFKYTLTVRPPRPDFSVKLEGANPTINKGSGKEIRLVAQRIDEFDGAIQVKIENLPSGLTATTPIEIEAGHEIAWGTINAAFGDWQLTPEEVKAIRITASATINGQEVTKELSGLGEIKLAEPPKLLCALVPEGAEPRPIPQHDQAPHEPAELVIAPGETITATLRVERRGYDGDVQFEALETSLPHGVYIDNIGLNGVLIPADEEERTVFLTASDWLEESSRLIHLRAQSEGNQTTWPVLLHVRKRPVDTPAGEK